MTQLENWFDGIFNKSIEGDVDFINSGFIDAPRLNSPFYSKEILGAESVKKVSDEVSERLRAYQAHSKLNHFFTNGHHCLAEYTISGSPESILRELPVAIAAELEDGKVKILRFYHSTWLRADVAMRQPILPNQSLKLPGPVSSLIHGMKTGNPRVCLKNFTEDGYIREAADESYIHEGSKARMDYFSMLLSRGGLTFEPCCGFTDNHHYVLEYNCNHTAAGIPPQPGLAVFELSDDGELIKAARIYDSLSIAD